jgi:hypothetical protein
MRRVDEQDVRVVPRSVRSLEAAEGARPAAPNAPGLPASKGGVNSSAPPGRSGRSLAQLAPRPAGRARSGCGSPPGTIPALSSFGTHVFHELLIARKHPRQPQATVCRTAARGRLARSGAAVRHRGDQGVSRPPAAAPSRLRWYSLTSPPPCRAVGRSPSRPRSAAATAPGYRPSLPREETFKGPGSALAPASRRIPGYLHLPPSECSPSDAGPYGHRTLPGKQARP